MINPYIFPIKGDISRADAIVLYEEASKNQGTIMEFGVGGSTIFLGASENSVIAYENEKSWIERVNRNIEKYNEKLPRKMDIDIRHIDYDYYGAKAKISTTIEVRAPFLYFVDATTKHRPLILNTIMEHGQRGDTILVHDTKDQGYLTPVFRVIEEYNATIESVYFQYRNSNITKITIGNPVAYVNWNEEERGDLRIDVASEDIGI